MTFRALLLTVALLLAGSSTALGVPMQLAHQGYLSDSAGEAITGSVVITFSLWDEAEDGSQVWTEARTVDVVDGVYTTLLGSEMPIADVLRQEPALWLQLQINGEPLLPRHPVASAPYAVVADTAINVDGGTVNASSVSIGGSEVIDASGSWTGGAGSIDWSSVTGDPDTLGALSCADGDRAVWNDGSQLWECGSASVTLDRLDTAAAVGGQVLTYDGAQAAWEDPGATSGGCSMSATGAGVLTLDCGGTLFRVPVEEEYIGLIDGQTRLRADGSLKDYTGLAPAGVFTEVFGSDRIRCAIDGGGATTCWRNSPADSLVQPPAGAYESGTCGGGDVCCAITQVGSLVCWDADSGLTSHAALSGIPTGAFSAVALYNNLEGCAISTGGAISCWGSNSGFHTNRPQGSGFTKISTSGSVFCAGGPTGGACWDQSGAAPFTVPAGDYVQMSGSFGLLASGQVLDFNEANGLPISQDLFQAIGSTGTSPGLTTDGRLAPLNGRGAYWPGP